MKPGSLQLLIEIDPHRVQLQTRLVAVQALVVMMLLIRIPLGRRQVPAQFLCRSARAVAGGVALDTPPLCQRTCVHRIEAEMVEQMCHSGFGIFVVTSDDQRAAMRQLAVRQ
jgi:hypothetical protein